jgi:hypothetical protein
MIPRLVNPWLHLQEVFVTGLSSQNNSQISGFDELPADETGSEAR